MKAQAGLSLVEVVIALLLVSIAVLGLQLAAAGMVHQTALSQVRLTAAQLAEDRIDLIRLEPVYDNLRNYGLTETAVTNYPQFRRTTTVAARRDSTASGITSYTRVSVAVATPALRQPIVRTITVGAP